MKDLTVFILTHNRGEMLLETIDSILNQTCHDFKFIVSDNSSNDDTARLLKECNLWGKFEYRKRDHEYSSFDHFNMCLSEVDTTYFVLFHDDDIMLPNYVETMYNAICGSEYVAVGCNALYLKNRNFTKKKSCKLKKDAILTSKKELAEYYCRCNIVPFPSYVYNRDKLENIKFTCMVGKYSDVIWLLDLIGKGYFCWLKRPLLYYRIHDDQDSQKIDFINQLKLFGVYKNIYVNNHLLIKIRLFNIYIYENGRCHFRNLKVYFKISKILFFKALIKNFIYRFFNKEINEISRKTIF